MTPNKMQQLGAMMPLVDKNDQRQRERIICSIIWLLFHFPFCSVHSSDSASSQQSAAFLFHSCHRLERPKIEEESWLAVYIIILFITNFTQYCRQRVTPYHCHQKTKQKENVTASVQQDEPCGYRRRRPRLWEKTCLSMLIFSVSGPLFLV